jgi:hypothetical protein
VAFITINQTFILFLAMGISVKDVDPHEYTKALAAFLKK